VLFAYGGEPRKNLAMVAAWARLVGAGERAQKLAVKGLDAYVVRTPHKNAAGNAVAIVWVDGGATRPLALGTSVTGYDLMGNELPRGNVTVAETPIYLMAPQVGTIERELKDR
jgi:hypothetical protein